MNPEEQQKLGKLREMIFQLALGNFAYRFYIEDKDDEIENTGLLMNLLAEELSEFFIYPGVFGEKNLVDPYVFIINSDFIVQSVNSRFENLVQYLEPNITGRSLTDFITAESNTEIREHLKLDFDTKDTYTPIKLLISILSKDGNITKCWGYCHFLKKGRNIQFLFRGLPIGKKNHKNSEVKASSPEHKSQILELQYQADILRIRKVHQYILNNLHRTLPTLKEIAKQFNLNEFKLKKGFKAVYQTTVFKFHLNQRLEMTLLMIRDTPMPLKMVSKTYGFQDYTHFSKTFKKKFGKTPKAFKKSR